MDDETGVVPIDWDRYKHFTRAEFACRGTNECQMNAGVVDTIASIRSHVGFPLPVTSGYRTPEHNRAVGGGRYSAHLEGLAVDIAVTGARAFRLVQAALKYGVQGIGIYPTFVHLDWAQEKWVGSDRVRQRPMLWHGR